MKKNTSWYDSLSEQDKWAIQAARIRMGHRDAYNNYLKEESLKTAPNKENKAES